VYCCAALQNIVGFVAAVFNSVVCFGYASFKASKPLAATCSQMVSSSCKRYRPDKQHNMKL
jgi:hypothetical protein